jgi:hypothetical protein
VGDVKSYRVILSASERPDALKIAMQDLADEYGWEGVMEQAIEGADGYLTAHKRGRGRARVWRGSKGAETRLMHVWMAVEREMHVRKMDAVHALAALFSRGKPWHVFVGDKDEITIKTAGRARKLHSDAKALMKKWENEFDPRYPYWIGARDSMIKKRRVRFVGRRARK